MRKSIFSLIVMVVLALSSCDGFKSQTYKLGDDYVATTSLSDEGDTLWTVKAKTGEIVLGPIQGMPYIREGFFLNNKKGPWADYYSLKGKPLGNYKNVEKVSQGIYKANSKNGFVLYFEESQEVISVQDCYFSSGCLGYQTDSGFTVVSTQGESTTWNVPEGTFYWVDGQPGETEGPAKAKMVVLGKKNATVYSMDGKEEKTIPLARLKSLTKKIKMTPLGSGQRCEIKTKL